MFFLPPQSQEAEYDSSTPSSGGEDDSFVGFPAYLGPIKNNDI